MESLGPIVQAALHESGAIATHLYLVREDILQGKTVAYTRRYARKMSFVQYALQTLGMPDSTHIQIPLGKGSDFDTVIEKKEIVTVHNMFDLVFPALPAYLQNIVGRVLLGQGTRYLGIEEIVSLPLTDPKDECVGVIAYGNPRHTTWDNINELVLEQLLS